MPEVKPFPQARVMRWMKKLHLTKPYMSVWRTELFYRLATRGSVKLYHDVAPHWQASPAAARVTNDLRRDGIAVADIGEFVDAAELAELYQFVDRLAEEYRQSQSGNGKFDQWYHRLEGSLKLADNHPPTRIITKSVFAQIAADYMQMAPRLREGTVMITNPFQAERTGPQRWHRDPHDRKYFKVTLLLNDYTAENGAMQYLCGTHADGQFRDTLNFADQRYGEARTFDDAEVQQAFGDRPKTVTMVGGRGRLFFFDTSGLHRSGYDPVGGRLVLNFSLNTSAYFKNLGFTIDDSFPVPQDRFMRYVCGL